MNKLIIVSSIVAVSVIGAGIICYLNWPDRQKNDQEIKIAPPVNDTGGADQIPENDSPIDSAATPPSVDNTAAIEETAATTPAPAPQNSVKKPASTAPSLMTSPLQQAPDLNPVNQGNPIRKIKTNPFE